MVAAAGLSEVLRLLKHSLSVDFESLMVIDFIEDYLLMDRVLLGLVKMSLHP